jgi:hypothetical protein
MTQMYVRSQAFKCIVLTKIHLAFIAAIGRYAEHSPIHRCAYDMYDKSSGL